MQNKIDENGYSLVSRVRSFLFTSLNKECFWRKTLKKNKNIPSYTTFSVS